MQLRGIGSERYRINKYVNLNIYFPGVQAYINYEAYIIEGLKTNVLIKINFLNNSISIIIIF